ncbi:CubicO group peptidase, beta-lactamase class C family [Paenibacillus sp. 1_12]|uniref:serine hydrolase domain-containing protein n=1 Tax=Paenibacillus sp. 1_12 TaxID=1566278 RepID=UPI0008EC0CEA|nr:serine hydrolase domain-containing protein [Paenibacillus sp. 1_12]SFL67010.1 CubicO group peptidase, beta-lactamase class C family [Paenibacillus sp. 1_12]
MILEERIFKWIESYDQNGYLNGSILIASNGNILVDKGFGLASWEHKIPNTPTNKFRIGSMTKAFTAMCILQLHEKKKLHINDYMDKYLPDYPNGDQITIYHCLTNTSGIANYTSFPDFWSRTMRLPSTLHQLIGSFQDRELDFEPGSRFRYSNSGYALLTAIIEIVSGMSYADYISAHICLPLGMVHTGCDNGVKVIADLASGYSFWEEPIHPAYADLSFPLGGYGLYSTTEDLYIWDQALTSSQMLSKELMETMFTSNLGSYACGWMVSDILGRKCVHHYGDISGYFSDFLRFPDDQVTIIFLSNMNVTPVTHLSREIAKTIFEENVSLPIPAVPILFTEIESVTGSYLIENETKQMLDISVKNDELYLTVPKMYGVLYKFKLVPVSHDSIQTTFVTEMIHEQLVFYYSKSGQIEQVEYKDYFGKNHRVYKH